MTHHVSLLALSRLQQHKQQPAQESSETAGGARAGVKLGQRVSTNLYGRGMGTVVAIHGEQAPESVRALMGGAIASGGRAEFDIAFDGGQMSRRLPESILHGIQWRIYPEVVGEAEIEAAKARTVAFAEEAARQKQAEDDAFQAAIEALRSNPNFAHLTPTNDRYDRRGAAANIRAHLKHSFPGVRFSVRSSHAGSLDVRWTDGPADSQVRGTIGGFKGGRFDGMTDSYESTRTPFGEVFGTVKYLDTRRERSDEIIRFAIDLAFSTHDLGDAYRPDPDDFKRGTCFGVPVVTRFPMVNDLQSLIHAIIRRTSATAAGFEYDPERYE